MTVRTWFRLVRGELWRSNSLLASDLDAVASACTQDRALPLRWVRVGSVHFLEELESYQRRERLLWQIRQQMREAMRRLAARGLTD